MKVPIVIDKKKKSQKVNNYGYDNSDNSYGKSAPRFPKFINFSFLKDKFSHFKWLSTLVLMKISIVVNKKKSQKVNNYGYDNSDDSNDKSKPRSLKFINFLLPMDQDVLSDLQLQLW